MIMMVKRLKMCLWQLVSCVGLLFVVGGCDDHEPRPESQPVAAVNGRLLLASSFIYEMDNAQYNADKRPKSFTLVQLNKDVSVDYTANSATYTTKVNGQVSQIKVFELENNVAKKATEYTLDNNGNPTQTEVSLYSYKAGKLFQDHYYENGNLMAYTEFIYDQNNENILEMRRYDANGVLQQKFAYTYTNLLDKSVLFNAWDNKMEGTLFPKKSKYLIQSRKIEINGIIIDSSTFSYVVDGQGYVANAEATYDNGDKDTWTNTWQ